MEVRPTFDFLALIFQHVLQAVTTVPSEAFVVLYYPTFEFVGPPEHHLHLLLRRQRLLDVGFLQRRVEIRANQLRRLGIERHPDC